LAKLTLGTKDEPQVMEGRVQVLASSDVSPLRPGRLVESERRKG